MTSGFNTWKDVLDVVGIPVALAILAIAWPPIQSWYRCRRFKLLTGRELEEIGPFPEMATNQGSWKNHLQKSFLHQQIIKEISDNRDFVLGLDPDFVYSVSQLWKSYDAGDGAQWLWYLGELASHRYLRKRKQTLLKIRENWKKLIESYGES
jgi:hypothetical protein